MNTENTQPQLKIEDLRVLQEIVELSVKRGTFTASECSAVGAAYDKLNWFLTHIQAAEAEAAEATKTVAQEESWENERVQPASTTTTPKKNTSKGE